MRRAPRAATYLVAIAAGLAGLGFAGGTRVVLADPNNPCDAQTAPPFCDSALGPLRDVTATWRTYQPALIQPVPVSDYCAAPPTCAGGDGEDRAPLVGPPTPAAAGWCGTETVHQPASGPAIPASIESSTLPAGLPAPPGRNHPYAGSRYCLLRYVPDDFAPLCSGCHRILIDYAAVPNGTYNSTSPAADGHWAARFTTDSSLSATTPVNEHSPNIKNLCADKFVNPAPGAGCVSYVASLDLGTHEYEGDATIFHHYPFEGRYFNGPSYLAGDGGAVPYHWVNGAFFDVNPGAPGPLPVWYNAGYRGLGDPLPDTDQSYGCACEAPGSGHTTWSPSLVLAASTTAAPSASPATTAASTSAPPSSGGLPGSATPHLPLVELLLGAAVAALLAGATAPLGRRR